MLIAIQAIPERARHFGRLITQLGEMDQTIVGVFCDHEHRGNLWNARRCWRAVADQRQPVLVLQDDATLLSPALERVSESLHRLARSLEAPVQLWMPIAFDPGWLCSQQAQGHNLIRYYGAGGICFASVLTPELAAWFAAASEEMGDNAADDGLVARLLGSRGLPTYCTVPSLVEHDWRLASCHSAGVIHDQRFVPRDDSIPAGHFEEPRVVDWKRP